MLKGIDPVIGPDLLWVLGAMRHGDTVVVCDANFPAESVARDTATRKVLRLDGVSVPRAIKAILSLMPLDIDGGPPVLRMTPTADSSVMPPVQRDAQAAIQAADARPVEIASLERFDFYAAARRGFAVVLAGDGRAYGCFLLRKGVIFFDDEPLTPWPGQLRAPAAPLQARL